MLLAVVFAGFCGAAVGAWDGLRRARTGLYPAALDRGPVFIRLAAGLHGVADRIGAAGLEHRGDHRHPAPRGRLVVDVIADVAIGPVTGAVA